MKQKISFIVLAFVMFGLSLWAYPIYDLNSSSLTGLDQSEAKNSITKYVFQRNTTSQEFMNVNKQKEPPSFSDRTSTLFISYEPYYLRLADKNGKTLWKTTTLDANQNDDTWDSSESPKKNKEYVEGPIYEIDNALLLYDIKDSRYVLKKDNGDEISYPKEISKYWIRPLFNERGITIKIDKFIFLQHADDDNQNLTPFELAIVNYNGTLEGICKTDIVMSNLQDIYIDKSSKFLLLTYIDKKGAVGLLVISMNGTLIKNYPNFNPGNIISFNIKAPDYSLLRSSDPSGKLILDNRTGEIVAGFDYECIDITEVDGKLIAVVGNGPGIFVIDVLNGKLIQNFTNLGTTSQRRKYEVPSVKISPDAKEIWFMEKYPDDTVKYYNCRKRD